MSELADGVLVKKTAMIASDCRIATANLLAYLGEVDRRKLHRQEACSSMFAYCVQRLGMSEDEAGTRITVARLGRRLPVALRYLAEGKTHLTGLLLLAEHLTIENAEDVLCRASGDYSDTGAARD